MGWQKRFGSNKQWWWQDHLTDDWHNYCEIWQKDFLAPHPCLGLANFDLGDWLGIATLDIALTDFCWLSIETWNISCRFCPYCCEKGVSPYVRLSVRGVHCVKTVQLRHMVTSSTFVLLVVGVVWKVNGIPPREPKLLGDQAENWQH